MPPPDVAEHCSCIDRISSLSNKQAVFFWQLQYSVPHCAVQATANLFPRQAADRFHGREGVQIVDDILHICDSQAVRIIKVLNLREEVAQNGATVLKGKGLLRVVPEPKRRQDFTQALHDPVLAIGSSIKPAVRLQHPPYLRQPPLQIRHVIEHHVGDHRVKTRIREGQLLNIRNGIEQRRLAAERFSCSRNHGRGEICQDQLRAAADQCFLSLPHAPGPAAKLQNARAFRNVVMRDDPRSKALPVYGVLLMDRDSLR